MMELELLILEFWSFKTAYVENFSTWNYKLELQKLNFSTIKISKIQTRFQKHNTLTQTQNTLTLKHSPPSYTQTLTLPKTLLSSVAKKPLVIPSL